VDNGIFVDTARGVLQILIEGVLMAGVGRSGFLYLKGAVTESAFTEDVVMSGNYVIFSGVLSIGISGKRVATLDSSGNLQISSVIETTPFGDFTISSDGGATQCIGFSSLDVGGFANAILNVKGVRENAL
jgi:hypothetical protein